MKDKIRTITGASVPESWQVVKPLIRKWRGRHEEE
jgi:hypothetical protein